MTPKALLWIPPPIWRLPAAMDANAMMATECTAKAAAAKPIIARADSAPCVPMRRKGKSGAPKASTGTPRGGGAISQPRSKSVEAPMTVCLAQLEPRRESPDDTTHLVGDIKRVCHDLRRDSSSWPCDSTAQMTERSLLVELGPTSDSGKGSGKCCAPRPARGAATRTDASPGRAARSARPWHKLQRRPTTRGRSPRRDRSPNHFNIHQKLILDI